VKSVGADSDAATVCPVSTLREITTPSMGEMMLVYERFTCAVLSCAAACASCALAASIAACVVPTLASAVSRSCWAARFASLSALVRANCRSALRAAALAETTPALAWR